jgi:hypothetical protein
MKPIQVVTVGLLSWMLFVPRQLKTCPITEPCTYTPEGWTDDPKEGFQSREACEQAAVNWKTQTENQLAKEHKRLVATQHAICLPVATPNND